jgi:nucleoside-diphosphate-sugar epimerase
MRAFVTGGSGFLGRNLIRTLRARGDEVRALARSDGASAAVSALGAEPFRGDLRGDLDDSAELARGMNGCEVVFHGAASLLLWDRGDESERINVGGTERALAAAKSAGVKKFVHVSTEAVLVGGPPIIRADESWPRPAHPIGAYPRTKGLAEERVLAANGAVQTVIVRPRFIWGPDDTSVLPVAVEAVKSGLFRWVGGGRHLTSTCHVDNVVHGMLLAAERAPGGQIYFLTDGEPTEMREFMTRLLASAGVTPSGKSIPRWLARAGAWSAETAWRLFHLAGQPPITRAEIRLFGEEVTVVDDKARRELGYAPVVTREAGLRRLGERPRA